MSVKLFLKYFILSGFFWILFTLLIIYLMKPMWLLKNKNDISEIKTSKSSKKEILYTKEQKEFIHNFKIAFEDR